MIDLIIPVYNNNKNLEKCLCSVAMQDIKDSIEVYIIDDASDCDYNEILGHFQNELNIHYYRLDINKGAGFARQFGINKSNGEYIMFLDSDDMLYNASSVRLMYREILKGYEYISSMEYDERFNVFVNNENNLHGKMYQRYYIYKNLVIFNNTRAHEDLYFNNLVLIHSPKSKQINSCTYYYAFNKDSISDCSYDEYFNKIETLISNFKKVLKIGYEEKCPKYAIDNLVYNKNIYLNKVYNNAEDSYKQRLINWIDKYDLNEIKLM